MQSNPLLSANGETEAWQGAGTCQRSWCLVAEPGPEPGPPCSLSSALHCAFLPLGHALQVGRREPGSLGVLSAHQRLPPDRRLSALCPEALGEPRPPCQGWLSCLLPRSFHLLLPAPLPSRQSCCTFWGTTELSFHRDQRQARRPPLCPAVDVAPGHQGDARASGGLALPIHAVSPARRLRRPSVRPDD